MTFVEACRAWKAVTGRLPIPVTVLLEGEEETGGVNLPPFLEAHADELRADIGLICDTNMWDAETPAITTMLRGMVSEEVTIHGPDRDLHSGFYGNAAVNPNQVLATVIAALRDAEGRVTLPGFYDGVRELPAALRPTGTSSASTPRPSSARSGSPSRPASAPASVLEQVWSRPTCEINGMGGGYQGAGFKTVIPAVASAKISFRLVFDQDPDAVRAAFRAFVKERVPADCRVEFTTFGSARACAFDTGAPEFQKARDALTAEWGREAAFIGSGGSIPVNLELQEKLGMDVINAGFGLADDRIHSPNEKYNLASFHKGTRSWARILAALGA
jgi:acetylornithine deacetylase/succinyl-diaminopimelate desuccinylase-like protein